MILITSLLISFAIMFFAWLLYLAFKNPGIIDGFWPLTITFNACFFGLRQTHYSLEILLVYVCLFIWMLRLGGYLWLTRILPNHVDKRYIDLSASWQMKKSLGFLWNFLFQGLLAWVIAVPFFFLTQSPQVPPLFYGAIILISCSILLETLADYQLQQFKKHYKGQVCTIGLWHYSRHPNYFFEWLAWVGFALIAVSMQPLGWVGLLSPALLLFIMLVLTGPITEKGSLKSRGDAFKQYHQSTAYFVHWFKKK
jgi:steroid 5-alpha reductase family enzyme